METKERDLLELDTRIQIAGRDEPFIVRNEIRRQNGIHVIGENFYEQFPEEIGHTCAIEISRMSLLENSTDRSIKTYVGVYPFTLILSLPYVYDCLLQDVQGNHPILNQQLGNIFYVPNIYGRIVTLTAFKSKNTYVLYYDAPGSTHSRASGSSVYGIQFPTV